MKHEKHTIRSKSDLLQQVEAGEVPEMLFFWGHQESPNGMPTKSCLSQWFPASFTLDGVQYQSAEQFMMAEKARLFGDVAVRSRILATPDPKEAKRLGRNVANFNSDVWTRERFDIVVRGNVAKFLQTPAPGSFLEATGDRILVEASPYDNIWGIGLLESDARAREPRQWPGENLLGFALMQVRSDLRRKA